MQGILRMAKPLAVTFAVLFILTGMIYPVAVFIIGQIAFPYQAGGSLIYEDGELKGSSLIGQQFTGPGHFWPRPSYTANGPYDPMYSGGSNYGPTNKKLVSEINNRTGYLMSANGVDMIPSDLVMGSASGLEPYISLESALIQVPRVADARGLDIGTVEKAVMGSVEKPYYGLTGIEIVNIVKLNLLMDKMVN